MIFDLYIGRKATGVSIRPDETWRGVWRIHQGANVSDMVNIARAKEAAISWARPNDRNGGFSSTDVLHWKRRVARAQAA